MPTAHRIHNPSTVHPPLGSYSHGIEVPANARWLYISGQVGIGPDGKVGKTFAEQCEHAWNNVLHVAAASGMGAGDLVKVVTYLTRPQDVKESREIRTRILGDVRPASTLVVIAQLVTPEYLIEIEAHAAKA